jgi:hypothetical protein
MIPPSNYFRLPMAACRLFQIGNRQLRIWQRSLLISSVRQHRCHTIVVRFGYQHINIEMALSLIGLLRQNVPRMRMATLDLATGSQAKSLRRTLVRLKFWH